MDPIALTTSVIEIGCKVKASIDKLAQRRSRAKELATDVLVDLLRMAGFYDRNKSTLSYAALGPLRNSLDALNRDLYRLHERCQAYKSNQGDTTSKRLVSALKLWMASDEIEADLVRIKERIQTSVNFILLLSCARMEVGFMKLEQSILTNAYETRSRIRQLDVVFVRELLHGDPGLKSFDHSPSEMDDIDVQYILLKSLKLIDTISVATLPSSGANTLNSKHPHFTVSPKPELHSVIFRMASLQARARSEKLSVGYLSTDTFFLARTFYLLGAPDITQKLLGAVENCLRRTLRLGTRGLHLPHHIKEEDDADFHFLESMLCRRNYYTLYSACEESAACPVCDKAIKDASKAVQFSRSRLQRRTSPTIRHRLNFVQSLIPSIQYHGTRGHVEECFKYCSEALEIIHACGFSAAREITNVADAGVLQYHAQILYGLSTAQARACEYTSAYHTGMECITSIKALSNIHQSLLPHDFEYFLGILEEFQQELPTWTSVVRNPGHRTLYAEEYTDDDDVVDGSPRQIEWGIAF